MTKLNPDLYMLPIEIGTILYQKTSEFHQMSLEGDIKACNNKFENMFDRNYRRLILEEKLEQLQELKGSESNE